MIFAMRTIALILLLISSLTVGTPLAAAGLDDARAADAANKAGKKAEAERLYSFTRHPVRRSY
jgi:hypothetical protein